MTKAKVNPINTANNILEESFYDTDISGLFRPKQVSIVLDRKLEFYKPGMPQLCLMIAFITEGVKDLIATPDVLRTMSDSTIFTLCINRLVLAEKSPEKPESKSTMGSLYANTTGLRYLFQCIRECYPAIQNPELLTDIALVMISAILMNEMTTIVDASN